ARNDEASAPFTSCDRFTCTTSPATKGRLGVSVTAVLSGENVYVPRTAPLCLPKTRKLSVVIDTGLTAPSNVIVTAALLGAMPRRAGLIPTTETASAGPAANGSVHSATAQAMRAGVRIMTVASGRQRTIPTFGFATKRKPRHVASLEAQLDRRPLS